MWVMRSMLLHSMWGMCNNQELRSMGRVCNKVVMGAPELHYFKNSPTKTWIETRMISLPSSKQEKSNQNT